MTGWRDLAACRGMNPNMFYPAATGGGEAHEARETCRGCPVRTECLEAGRHEPAGLWGGLDTRQRRLAAKLETAGVTFRCHTCGQPFTPVRHNARYCSYLCRRDSLNNRSRNADTTE